MDESSLLDLLECPVCLERLDSTAKVLPCQHTFCKRCLQSIVSSRQGELRCPECRTLVRCTVDDLPSNILLLRLLDGITRGGHGPHHIPPPGQPAGGAAPAKVNRAARLAAAALAAAPPSSNGALPALTLGRSASVVSKQSLPVVPCARALYTYEGKEPGDLPFSKGDLVFLRRRIDDSWYHGETSAGAQGFFPASYVQVLRPLPTPSVPLLLQPVAAAAAAGVPAPGTPTVGAAQPQARPTPPPQCRALYDFAVSGGEQDKDCLTFSKDEVIMVIRRVDENWAEGMLGDKIGIFPISFVEFNTMAKLLLGLESANIHALGEALGQPQPSASAASSSSSSSSSSSAAASASSASSAAAAAAAAGDAGRKNAKKRHSFTSLTMSSKASGAGAQAQAAHQHRHSCDISAPVLISSSNPAAAARIVVAAATGNGLSSSAPSQIYIGTTGLIVTAVPTSPVTTVAPVSFHTEGPPASGPTEGQTLPAVVTTPAVVPGVPLPRPAPPSVAGTTEPAVPVPRPPPQQYPLIQIFVALYPYKPQKADELELRKGEMYRVLERCQDGWYKGSSLRTGTAGVFPGNYVAPVNRAPPVPQQKLPPPACPANSSGSCTGSGRVITVTAPVATVTTSLAINGGGLSSCPAAGAPQTSPRLGIASARHPAQGPAQNGVRPAPAATDKPVAAVPPIQSQGGSPRLSAAVVRPQPAAASPSSLPAPSAGPPAAPCPCPVLSSALASVASAITPPNVSAASLDEQAGLGGSSGVSAAAAGAGGGGACAGGKNEKGEKDKKERKSSFLKILSSASAKRKSRSPPLSASPPPPQSTHDAQQPDTHAMGATAATEVVGHGRSLTPPVAPPPRQPCSAMAPVRPETKPLQRERYRVVVPYPPQSDAELELREGDVVFVHRKRDDGWYKGTLQRNGKTGLFPGSFVESF